MAENLQLSRIEKLPFQYQQFRTVLFGYSNNLLNPADHRDKRIGLPSLCQKFLDIVRVLPVLRDYGDLQFLFRSFVIFEWLFGPA